jgi:hypothetical protein
MNFEEFLSEFNDAGCVDPESLKMMGKKAAAMFLTDKTPMNTSIANLVKEASLNEEQVKRVVEFANNEVFSELFRQDYDKNIAFPVADPGKVLDLIGKPVEKTASYIEVRTQEYIPGSEGVNVLDLFCRGDGEGRFPGPQGCS